jgi:hypothetical protein
VWISLACQPDVVLLQSLIGVFVPLFDFSAYILDTQMVEVVRRRLVPTQLALLRPHFLRLQLSRELVIHLADGLHRQVQRHL